MTTPASWRDDHPLASHDYEQTMPFYRFELESPLPPNLVIARIKQLVRPRPSFFERVQRAFGGGIATTPFIGRVDADSFKMSRDISHTNGFLPLIRGRVADAPQGSRVRVTARLPVGVALLMLYWFSGMTVGAVLMWTTQGVGPAWARYVPLGMLAFVLTFLIRGFFPEVSKARRILERALVP